MDIIEREPKKRFFYGRTRGRLSLNRQAHALMEVYKKVILPLPLQVAEQEAFAQEGSRLITQSLYDLFPVTVKEVWLEVGFGAGEHLLQQLYKNPSVGIIGVEPFEDGVLKILHQLSRKGPFIGPHDRFRLVTMPVQYLIACLPLQQFSRIYVLFPDPWPKKRHHKRRVVNRAFLSQCADLLRPGGKLYLGSDHADYVSAIWEALQAQAALTYKSGIKDPSPTTWPAWPSEWPLTRYGQKALAAEKPLAHMIWERAGR